jgi:hypothetical protein
MDTDQQIYLLHAETLAIQTVLAQVLHELKSLDPRFADAIGRGFDNAASLVENLAIKVGEASPPEHLVKALRIVEELRTASLRGHDKPRHGV